MSGFRLFRRKKLIPGVTMNLSRSGPSLRFGTRGAGITVGGRRRLRATVGLPGTGIYYTKTAGGGRRIRRHAAPLRSIYSAPTSSTSYKGCLYAIGVVVMLALTIVTYGLILIPVAVGVGAWIWYRRRQPDSIASGIIKQAITLEPAKTVDLLNQALEVDPHGLKTLWSCANWFYQRQCWQDAAEAYSGILQVQPDWDAERKYVTSLLAAGRADDAIPRLEHIRAMSPSGDNNEVAVLSQLAMAYFMKDQPSQAMAFVSLAPLQKRNLDGVLQGCLYLRAVGRYLTGDRRHAIGDLERLYAINPSFTDLMTTKAAMDSGKYRFPPTKPYPDWYPTDHRETNLPSGEPGQKTPATLPTSMEAPPLPPGDSAQDSTTSASADASPPLALLEQQMLPETPPATATGTDETARAVAEAQSNASDPSVSPDGVWRWDGTRWIPNSQLATPNVSPDWITQALWHNWDSPVNLIRGESRHQDVFLSRWSINPTRQHWEPVAVDLIREPDNPVDQNAVRAELNGQQVGYLAREVAAIFSPQLDRAARNHCTVAGVVCGGSADAPSFGLHLWLNRRLSEAPEWNDADG